ncbi:2-aminoethylphosphonate:pyruvate aminotransferase [Pseudomonas sp. R4-39-08]|uniref:2-aminoethylphosphonate--pyruvate transaminase n=1 Tax=Pseudomonas sp. R4-39-08 TaxID=1173288 RepID=UPI000F573957|nr:2-aminoethylphosphonate--pyruvate transaminase [Pseudomonas sp. R4-39-08]AZF38321.1 2-aminoethylphosphonate:pyruvate aminotransferase [Pseudomonas sp. R4-39-08]
MLFSTVDNQLLFTPGPLNTSATVKSAAMRDMGSRTQAMREVTTEIVDTLHKVSELSADYTTVLLQGSGTFAVEAMLSSLIDNDDHALVLVSGDYSSRMADICNIYGIQHQLLNFEESEGVCPQKLKAFLDSGPKQFSHLLFVHYETALGVVNPYQPIIDIAWQHGLKVLVDCVSSFGLLPINSERPNLVAMASSANKCIQGLTGASFVFVQHKELMLERKKRTLAFDLKAQSTTFFASGEWRFSPPVQILLGLRQALREYVQEGGRAQRYKKYFALHKYLESRLSTLGIFPIINAGVRAPIINTYSLPTTMDYACLSASLIKRNIVVYASKLKGCFRVGTAGDIRPSDIDTLVNEIDTTMKG